MMYWKSITAVLLTSQFFNRRSLASSITRGPFSTSIWTYFINLSLISSMLNTFIKMQSWQSTALIKDRKRKVCVNYASGPTFRVLVYVVCDFILFLDARMGRKQLLWHCVKIAEIYSHRFCSQFPWNLCIKYYLDYTSLHETFILVRVNLSFFPPCAW